MKTLNQKDPYSEIHSTRVAYYSKRLAKAAGLSKHRINIIETAALLHDIGKILIDDKILKSNQKLTNQEYELIKQHSMHGYNILSTIPTMTEISKIILTHHERIDGNGYPYHLKGDSIPLEAKIISIADAYDAMTGKRRYRAQYVKEEAILDMLEHKGTQFDEKLVNLFVDILIEEKT